MQEIRKIGKSLGHLFHRAEKPVKREVKRMVETRHVFPIEPVDLFSEQALRIDDLKHPLAKEYVERAYTVWGGGSLDEQMGDFPEPLRRYIGNEAVRFIGHAAYHGLADEDKLPEQRHPDFFAGMGLQEITAMYMAGALSFEDGARIFQAIVRGTKRALQAKTKSDLLIITRQQKTITDEQLHPQEDLLKGIYLILEGAGGERVERVIVHDGKKGVVGGRIANVRKAASWIRREYGGEGITAEIVNFGLALYTKEARAVAAAIAEELATLVIQQPTATVISGEGKELATAGEIRHRLGELVTTPISHNKAQAAVDRLDNASILQANWEYVREILTTQVSPHVTKRNAAIGVAAIGSGILFEWFRQNRK